MIDMDVVHIFALKDNQIFKLNRKVEEMQKALEWYADKENYIRSENDFQSGYPHEIMWDKGIKARQALKGESQ